MSQTPPHGINIAAQLNLHELYPQHSTTPSCARSHNWELRTPNRDIRRTQESATCAPPSLSCLSNILGSLQRPHFDGLLCTVAHPGNVPKITSRAPPLVPVGLPQKRLCDTSTGISPAEECGQETEGKLVLFRKRSARGTILGQGLRRPSHPCDDRARKRPSGQEQDSSASRGPLAMPVKAAV